MTKKELFISASGLCLILLLSLILYWPVPGFGWITGRDQELLVDNTLLLNLGWSNVFKVFLDTTGGVYSPLTVLSYGIDLALMPGNPVRMVHSMNLVLHILNILLFFRLVHMVSKQVRLAILATVIFALHPLNLDTVAWISSRGMLLSSFFFVSGLLASEYSIRSGKKIFRGMSLLACLAAMLSHPVAVLFPVALLILDLAQGRNPLSDIRFKGITVVLAVFFILLTVLVAAPGTWPGFRHGISHAVSAWIIPARFLIPLGISGTQTGTVADVVRLSYPLLMAMSASIALLFFFFWKGSRIKIVTAILTGTWLILVVYISFLRIGDWRNSEKYWNRIVELYPNSYLTYFHRGDFWAMRGDFNRAKFDYGQSIKLNPDAYEAVNNLGLIYLGENDLSFAIKEFNRSISIREDFFKPHLNLGLALMRGGNYDLAKESMTRAIELNPGEPLAYYNRGLIHERDDQLDSAILDFTSAIRIDPYRYIFYKDRGKALVWKQRFSEAEQDFSRALELDDSDPEMWFRRSLARVSQDKFRKGLEDALVARKLGMEVSEDYLKGLTRQILESDSVVMK